MSVVTGRSHPDRLDSHGIKFTDIDVSDSGMLECSIEIDGVAESFWVEMPYSFRPAVDLIAYAFTSICGTSFSDVHIDLPLGPETRGAIENATKAKVTVGSGTDTRRRRGKSQSLNFSGGFDSLAAWQLVPKAALISLDFGGRFAREREFFEQFDPYIFRTNLVDLKLNRYSWQFMGIGTLLMRDELDLGTYSFGSILAGSLPSLVNRPRSQRDTGISIGHAAGLSVSNPVVGITEISSMLIAARSFPWHIPAIMRSVALPKEDKYLRKVQMFHAISAAYGTCSATVDVPNQSPRRKWGESFATDLSCLYAMKQLGVDEIASTYRDGIPEPVADQIHDLDLDFMTRFNPHPYAGVQADVLGEWYSFLCSNGIRPYESKDWSSARSVINLLRG